MKKLLLIRHAKATQETGFKDFERPLVDRGLNDAALMAARLKERGDAPQMLISSPALRTLATANVFSEHLDLPQAQTNANIYEASQQALIQIVCGLPNEFDNIGMVGHNPGISQLLYYLTDEPYDVPTCAVMLINFEVESWEEITYKSGRLVYYDYPKN